MKKIYFSVILFLLICNVLVSQEILTADRYFEKVSAKFGNIADYEAILTITQDENVSKGVIYYKRPHLLRINFSSPSEQVIVVNNTKLTVYIPKYAVILEQELNPKSEKSLQTLATSQGFNFLRDNYTIAFLVGPQLIPLDEKSDEKVIKLKFIWRSIKEGFREIVIAFNEDGLIRRIIGKQAITNKTIQFDYTNLSLNQGISDERFEYDPPPNANVYGNFLFEDN